MNTIYALYTLGFIAFFMSGYCFGKRKVKPIDSESEPDYKGVLLSETLLLNCSLIEELFEILDISDTIVDTGHPYHNHKLYIVRFQSDPTYLFRTLALPSTIELDLDPTPSLGNKWCKFNSDFEKNKIISIDENHYFTDTEMSLTS